jgi:hypothetical protein
MSIRKFERFFSPEEYIQPSGCLPFKKIGQTLFAPTFSVQNKALYRKENFLILIRKIKLRGWLSGFG